MLRRAALTLVCAAAGLCGPPLAAANDTFDQDFAALRNQDNRLQTIGWRLLTANAPFCRHTRPAVGILVQDAAAYGQSGRVRAAAGITGDIFIQSVVSGSPADAAGLKPDSEILSVGGRMLADWPVAAQEVWRRQVEITRLIDTSLEAEGTVTLRLAGKALPVKLTGIPACSSRFELISGSEAASANGERVAIGRGFPGLEYPDAEFAAALAHELAHNFLGHAPWLDAHGRGRKNIRRTEGEADRLMPWLLANAGYDPAAAVTFMARWGPKHGGGLFRKRTHAGWDERAEAIAAEIPFVQASIAAHGAADWRLDFKRSVEGG